MPRPRRKGYWLGQRGGVFHAFWYSPSARRTQRTSLRTDDPVEAHIRFERFCRGWSFDVPVESVAPKKLIARWINRARTNARERGQAFNLDAAWVEKTLRDQKYRCAVTGIPFVFLSGQHNPWQPSIDRIDNDRGYFTNNCRIVCLMANLAMNRWGAEALRTLAVSLVHGDKLRGVLS